MFETPRDPSEPAPARSHGREPYGYPDERGYRRLATPAHSGLGIASFITGAAVILMTVLVIILAVAVRGNRGNRETAEMVWVMLGLIVCGGLVASLVGLGLGVGGLFQEDRNRTMAVIGVVLNGLMLIAAVAFVLIGMVLANRRY
jgi:hypothetical protein